MLGDNYSLKDVSAGAGFSEVYVCPQGFDGTYRMLVRRVWGKPTAGTGDGRCLHALQHGPQPAHAKGDPAGERRALVTFDLAGGRRKALEEQQVVNAVKQQEPRCAATFWPSSWRSWRAAERGRHRPGGGASPTV